MEELANHYGVDHWCFTVDVDELFVYPYMESASLNLLINHLEEENVEGMMCVFLDMYSDKALSETNYVSGTNFLDTCSFYETSTYSLTPSALPPYLAVTGGPRWRSLWDNSKVNSGPMMKKVPLVKWKDGFFYNYSTHSHFPIKLSQTTAVLQHFKFFSFFSELAEKEAQRGDRRQTKDYQNYANKLSTDDPCFFGPHSRMYNDSTDFVRGGVTAVSDRWQQLVVEKADSLSSLIVASSEHRPAENSVLNLNKSALGLGSLSFLWPHVNNESKAEISNGVVRKIKTQDITSLVERHASNITLIDIKNSCLLVKIEPIVWTLRHCKFTLVAHSNGTVIQCFDVNKTACDNNFLTKSFDASIHSFVIGDDSELCRFIERFGEIKPRMNFSLMAESFEDSKGIDHYIGLPCNNLPPMKNIRRGRVNHFTTQETSAGASNEIIQNFDGVLESIKDGVLRGWAVEKLPSNPFIMFNWDVPVSVYLNEWYVGETTHTYTRKDLAYESLDKSTNTITCKERPGYGFDFALPINFFIEKGISDFTLEVRIARRNVLLARSPCQWHGRSATWQASTSTWISESIQSDIPNAALGVA